MKKFTLTFSIVLFFVLAIILVNQANLHAAVGEPVPGAEIFIEQEPDDKPIAHTVTDNNGEFDFDDINGLPEGKYTVYIRIPGTKQLKNMLDKKKRLHIHLEIGKTRTKGKEIVVSEKILIKNSKAMKGKRIKVFSFKLKEDILFLLKSRQTASGSRGGFAVGGFSTV